MPCPNPNIIERANLSATLRVMSLCCSLNRAWFDGTVLWYKNEAECSFGSLHYFAFVALLLGAQRLGSDWPGRNERRTLAPWPDSPLHQWRNSHQRLESNSHHDLSDQ